MLHYNSNNIFVGEIKQILKNFNLPKARFYSNNEPLVRGLHYIKDGMIYYCSPRNGELVLVDTYSFNRPYFNITTNLRVISNVYDTYTHEYLGNYLRFLRDYYGLDLMSMYNCFSNKQLEKIKLKINKDENKKIEFNYNDGSYNIYCVPVKFKKEYTIAINSYLPIDVVACLYKNGKIIESDDVDEVTGETYKDLLYKNTYERIRSCPMTSPYIYNKLKYFEPTSEEITKEECLCLLIKVPVNCKSSIVVLEGDYTKCTKFNYSDSNKLLGGLFKYKKSTQVWENEEQHSGKSNEIIDKEPSWFGDYDYKSVLELLSYENSEGNGLIATRLFEYLCGNAITNISEPYDIKKLQRELIKRKYVASDYLGMWSDDDRKGLYRFINDFNLNSVNYDVISYLDKDIEYNIGNIE